MKVLFAISNPPTKEFMWSRHNVGRLFVTEHLLKKYNSRQEKCNRYCAYKLQSPNHLTVCLSETYMNLSGQAVGAFLRKNSTIKRQDLMVVHDDLEHKFGNVRIKEGGSSQYTIKVIQGTQWNHFYHLNRRWEIIQETSAWNRQAQQQRT